MVKDSFHTPLLEISNLFQCKYNWKWFILNSYIPIIFWGSYIYKFAISDSSHVTEIHCNRNSVPSLLCTPTYKYTYTHNKHLTGLFNLTYLVDCVKESSFLIHLTSLNWGPPHFVPGPLCPLPFCPPVLPQLNFSGTKSISGLSRIVFIVLFYSWAWGFPLLPPLQVHFKIYLLNKSTNNSGE